jgi:pilus assembly protein CpaC
MASCIFRGGLPIQWALSALMIVAIGTAGARSAGLAQPSIVHRIRSASERQEMTVNTSRILTLDSNIPQAQVNNPEVLELTPLSPTEIQIFAKKPGVTQVNLWDENKQIYTVDVIVYGDANELAMVLQDAFPKASLVVKQVSNSVLISGYVDDPNDMASVVQIAEEYYPKVLNNMKVGGVHQVLLHVKVMEVSRTKLRTMGFDWAQVSGGNIVTSLASGLILPGGVAAGGVATSGTESFFFSVVDGGSSFFGVLEALRVNNLMKVLAEPTLVTVSGRPAFFQVGGEFPILVPQSLGTVSIEYKKFGTQVDFVPIVLGNGNIRLEVRPRVSEIDNTRGVTLPGSSTTVPGLRVREVDTGVEMMAGQTLAIAGLVQTRVETTNRGLPWVSDVPYLGVLFRRVHEENNEVELLILVTPELVEAIDADKVPPCGPGTQTVSPNDWELYMRGYMEVPNCCPTGPLPPTGMQAPPGMILDAPPEPVQAPAPNGPVPPSAAEASGVSRSAPANPVSLWNRQNFSRPQSRPATSAVAERSELPGFIGPIGYETGK